MILIKCFSCITTTIIIYGSMCYNIASSPIVDGATTSIYATLTGPQNLAFATNGTLYVGRDSAGGLTKYSECIWRIGPGGSPIMEFGDKPITDPDAVIVDYNGAISGIPGSILIGGESPDYPQKIEGIISCVTDSGIVTTLFGPNGDQVNPSDFAFDNSGRLLMTDYRKNQVLWTKGASPARLCDVELASYLAIDIAGRIVVSQGVDSWLRLFDADGTLLKSNWFFARREAPIERGPGGFWNESLYTINEQGELVAVNTNGIASTIGTGFNAVVHMRFGPDGALYASEPANNRVLRISPGRRIPKVTGQWDFNHHDLWATVGYDLIFIKSITDPDPVFGTTTTFNIPNIDGKIARVMSFPKCSPYAGFIMKHSANPNGGGKYVNRYSLIMDIMFPAESSYSWRAIMQTGTNNLNDADLFINNKGGTGISSQYHGNILPNNWYRLGFVFDLTQAVLVKYINGQRVASQTLSEGIDGRWSLDPSTLLFTDENNETDFGYVNSIQFRDDCMTDDEIKLLGGPSFEGIPLPVSDNLMIKRISRHDMREVTLTWTSVGTRCVVEETMDLLKWSGLTFPLDGNSITLSNSSASTFYRLRVAQ